MFTTSHFINISDSSQIIHSQEDLNIEKVGSITL